MAPSQSNVHGDSENRPDEWKIEQGMAAAALPVLDMTGPETIHIPPAAAQKDFKDEEAIKAVGDRNALFQMERTGWKG